MLTEVVHPAQGSKSIIELGMVHSVSIDGNKVTVTLAFPKDVTLSPNILSEAPARQSSATPRKALR